MASTFFKLSFLLFSFLAFSLDLSSTLFVSPDVTFPVLDDLFFRSVEILSFSDDFLVCDACLGAGFFEVSSLIVDFDFDPVFFFSKLFL